MIIINKTKNPENPLEISNITFEIDDSGATIDELVLEFGCLLKAMGYHFDEIMVKYGKMED